VSAASKDPLAIGIGSLAAGTGLGGATITLAQIVVKLLQGRLDPDRYREAAGDPLLAGLLAGVAIAGFFGWRRSQALENVWQRGVIGVLAAVGALLVGFLAAVADRFLKLPGLVVWGALSLAVGMTASRWAIAGSGIEDGRPGPGTGA
jgi:hypothetical protein